MYEKIELAPYAGNERYSIIDALVSALDMNIYFDDVDASTCRFCFKADQDAPIVDYDIEWSALENWFEGKRSLTLEAQEHDPERFADDLKFS